MKCAIYARVSTVDKDQDPEVQLRLLRARAVADEMEVYEEYVDYASGKDWNRPRLLQMFRDAKAHRFKTIYILRLDRLSRSVFDFLEMLKKFKAMEPPINIVSMKDVGNVDTTTPEGEFLLTILLAFDQMERRVLGERTKEGLAKARADGVVLGRRAHAVDVEGVLARMEDETLADIAEDLGISKRTLQRRLAAYRRGDNDGGCP